MDAQPRTRLLTTQRRTLVLTVACAFCLLFGIPQIAGFFDSRMLGGGFGWALARDGTVKNVTPGHGADRAGVRAGDRVMLERLPFEHVYRVGPWSQPTGYRVSIDVARGSAIRHISVVSQGPAYKAQDWVALSLVVAQALLFLAIGLFVLMRRTDAVGIAFFLYCSTAPITGLIVRFYSFVPDPLGTALFAFTYFWFASPVQALTFMGFALYFPAGITTAKRRILPLFWLLTIAGVAEAAYELAFELRAASAPSTWNILTFEVLLAMSLALFVTGYLNSNAVTRTRLVWAIVALAYNALVLVAGPFIIAGAPPNIEEWLNASLTIVPLLLAYAILHEHVFDITFTLNRAIVYTLLTATLAVTIGVLDWAAERFVGSRNFALALEAIVVVSFGFVADELRRRLSHVVEKVVFRERHAAEHAMERIAANLPFAQSIDAIGTAVVDEVATALNIASGAFFLRQDDRRYTRVRASGWSPSSCDVLSVSDDLVQTLRLQLQPRSDRDELRRALLLVSRAASERNRPRIQIFVHLRRQAANALRFPPHQHVLSANNRTLAHRQDIATVICIDRPRGRVERATICP